MGLKERLRRVFELCDPVPEALFFESGPHGQTDPNFFYATGFQWGALTGASAVLRPGERPVLISSIMEAESARRDRDVEVLVTRNRREHETAIVDALGSEERIGYNPYGLTSARFRALTNLLPGAKWVDVSAALARARLVKDPQEVSHIRKAAEITAATVEEIPALLEEGMRETDLAAEIDYRLQRSGANGFAFDTIVAFGPNAAEPHHQPAETQLEPGSLVLADVGARVRRYCADLTRTFAFGDVGRAGARMHEVVARAQEAALACLEPGRKAAEVHEAAERVIAKSEFRGRFIHAVGHSVGLEAQDGMVLHAHADFTINPGMVFAVEPGVYVPGQGGVRIEDTVLVTDRGIERLTRASRNLTASLTGEESTS